MLFDLAGTLGRIQKAEIIENCKGEKMTTWSNQMAEKPNIRPIIGLTDEKQKKSSTVIKQIYLITNFCPQFKAWLFSELSNGICYHTLTYVQDLNTRHVKFCY